MFRLLSPKDREAVSRELERFEPEPVGPYAHDPVGYAREMLGVEPWSRQRELLEAVRDHDRVSVRSGHKVAKSNSAGCIAWWWCSDPVARPEARCILTSSGYRQVKSTLWREIKGLYRKAITKPGPAPADAPDTGVQWGDGREIIGFTTKEPEKMAGFSGKHILFILDEASGIPEEIFEAIEGNRAGGRAKILLLSNPTQLVGEFYASHTTKRAFYRTLHISSEESPNVTGEAHVEGLATKEWVAEKRAEWGEDSPLYQVRVRGNFPGQGSNAVVALTLVLAGVDRWDADEEPDEPLELGLDVARTGDDESVLYPRRGTKALAPRAWQGLDGPDLAGKVLEVVRELRRPGERPRVKVDANGVGASAYDALRRYAEVEAVAVNTAEASSSPEVYANLRAQISFGVAVWLREGGALPDHAKTQADLVAPKYSFDARNRYLVQKKDEVKKVLKRSPDYGDALGLSIYSPPREPDAEPPPAIEDDGRWAGVEGRGF